MKLSKRDRIIFIVVLVIGIGYVSINFLYLPMYERILKGKEELSSLVTQNRDISGLSRIQEAKSKELVEKTSEFEKFNSSFLGDKIVPEKFLIYIGDASKELDVELTYVEELDPLVNGGYSYSRYEIRLYGDYKDVLKMSDRFYVLSDTLYVEEMELKETFILPLELLVRDGLPVEVPFDWTRSSLDRVERMLDKESLISDEVDVDELYRTLDAKTELHVTFRFMNNVD